MAEKTVLFVCVQNACRSLMAEAMFNGNPVGGWRAISAGTQPALAPHPRTEGMLREIGLELPAHPPQLLTDEMMTTSRVIVTMGCLEDAACPARLKALELRDWALPDPARLDEAGFRAVRDRLAGLVKGLRTELVVSDRRTKALAEAASARPT